MTTSHMQEFDTPLPIDDALPRLTAALAGNNAAVLVAPPGAGKTTRVPLVLLDEPWAKDKKILVLEPRRLAARAAAARMASTLGEQVGDTVGLRVRFGSKISKRTRIEVITEGVFTRLILDDPSLDGIAAVLFDEFHERSLDADLGLALARDVQQGLREELKILVMSATLDGARVAALLGGAPVVESQGRSFDVETRYLGRDPRARIEAQVTDAVQRALRADQGSLLVFLPGAGEIRRTETLLTERVTDRTVDIVALFGALDAREQDRAISPAPPGRRKVVLATSIAETSLTIEGVRVVIDCRPRAGAALRTGCRPHKARNRARVARGRRPAPRPRRPHRAGRLLPAVGRTADRVLGALYAAGDSLRRSVVFRARPGAMGRQRSGKARLSRFAATGRAQRGARVAQRTRRHRLSRPHHRRGPPPARAAVAAAARPHGGRCGGGRRGRIGGADCRRAHRAWARRRRSRSAPPARSIPPRPLAPRRGGEGDGETLER